jgi:mRNA-degrading endonuclease RelE of RelBE toxin-antitoxin system
VLIVETANFTRRLQQILGEEQYRLLQTALVASPEAGSILRGSGGIRKLRWAGSGRGKRGGVRVLYHWSPVHERLLMLFIFRKNERSDLSREQLKQLRSVVEKELK